MQLPSRKWAVTQVTAITAWLVAFIQAGEFNTTIAIAAIGIGSQALIAYLIPNAGDDVVAEAPHA